MIYLTNKSIGSSTVPTSRTEENLIKDIPSIHDRAKALSFTDGKEKGKRKEHEQIKGKEKSSVNSAKTNHDSKNPTDSVDINV